MAISVVNSDGTTNLKNLLFSRGCYEVEGTPGEDANDNYVAPDLLYQYAAQVDQNLKALPTPCPTGAPAASSSTGTMVVGLACDPSQLQEAGQVLCTAAVSNQRSDAQLTYEWTVDGQIQSETSNTLSLSGIQPGTHPVSVRATDTQNNLSTDPASTSLIRNPVGSTGQPSGGLSPLVAGAALAIGGALVVLLLRRRRRGAHPAPASAAPATPPPAPEPLSKQEQRQEQHAPEVTVTLRASPSVQTRGLYPDETVTPRIWGDGVDLVCAEYHVSVTPSAEWVIDRIDEVMADSFAAHPTPYQAQSTGTTEFSDMNEDAYRADTYPEGSLYYDFASQQWSGDTPVTLGPSATQSQAVVRAKWSRQDHPLTISATVTVTVRNRTDPTRTKTFPNQVARRTIQVIGAKPSLEVWADTSADRGDGLSTIPAGAEPGFADGSYWLHLAPQLTLFEQLYPGGLQNLSGQSSPSTGVEQQVTLPSGDKLSLVDYFEATVDELRFKGPGGGDYREDPRSTKRQQGVTLRCKFHLEDAAIKRLRDWSSGSYPVSFKVRPTGHAYGEESLQGPLDWMASPHYKACRDHLADGVSPDQPLRIYLVPSKVEAEPLHPRSGARIALPWKVELPWEEGDDRYTCRLSVAVRSGTGKLAEGKYIKSDLLPTGLDNWGFRFWYQPPEAPTEAWRRRVDQGLPEGKGLFINAADVDSTGHVVFGPPDTPAEQKPFLAYNHQEHFAKPIPPTKDACYLFGQTCDMHVQLEVPEQPNIDVGLLSIKGVEWENFIARKLEKSGASDLATELDKIYSHTSASHIHLLAEPWNKSPIILAALASAKATIQSNKSWWAAGAMWSGKYISDEYSVVIDQMPPGLTPEQFLAKIASNFNRTINNTWFDRANLFYRRGPGNPWESFPVTDSGIKSRLDKIDGFPPPYIGEIYDIDIVGPDNGSVILVESTPSHFIVQTIDTPNGQTGSHPEYGAREWGFERNPDKTVTFYTRAVSTTGPAPLTNLLGDPGRRKGWRGLCEGISNEMTRRGGRSTPTSVRSWAFSP